MKMFTVCDKRLTQLLPLPVQVTAQARADALARDPRGAGIPLLGRRRRRRRALRLGLATKVRWHDKAQAGFSPFCFRFDIFLDRSRPLEAAARERSWPSASGPAPPLWRPRLIGRNG